ncbi:hypothetical protein R3W88_021561 [Solanum pinnatisectum]|uniref:RNase H type-1 domain-containing protein n=1 Tax=Solanum pinnatisectum TaxID=50273 RepID=A0AAV9LS78_9SOLN|nr:hypothetical protein R3W88_021561 [Solanum pinnatisectum]
MEYDIIGDEDQMLTLKVHSCGMGIDVMISVIYAKCTQGERLNLWESMAHLASTVNIPWVIGGDFNVITNESEKLGGREVTDAEVRDFNHCLNVCNLEDRGVFSKEDLTNDGEWDEDVVKEILPTEFADHILGHIKPPQGRIEDDKPCWMLDNTGAFTVKSAWNYIRHREDPNRIYKWIWTMGVPFKMAFLMWRLWKFKILVDDRVRRWGIAGPSRCWCCVQPDHWHKGNTGLSSYAFCLRDERGDIIHAEGVTIENATSTVTEAKAILEASKHCKQRNLNKVIIQTDSMLLKKVLTGEWAIPWSISDVVEEIRTKERLYTV